MSPIILVTLVLFQVYQLEAARILGVIPSAVRSHHIPFQPLWRELALRGHEVTVITTEPLNNSSLENLKELDISYCYEIYKKHKVVEAMASENNSYYDIAAVFKKAFVECHEYLLSSPGIQELIHNKDIKFDLLIAEAQLPTMFAFAWRFKCPSIAIASLEPALQFHDSLGNLVHPLISPDPNLNIEDDLNMSFMDRAKSFFYILLYKHLVYNKAYPSYDVLMKKYFGEELPTLKSIQDDISIMLVGSNPLFNSMRPTNLNTISVGGGMHAQPYKKLPADLQTFLDEGEEGVIYFSLGSNINLNLLTDNFKKAIVEAFAEVPYKVLLKMDGQLNNVSKNVLVRKWMPQQDIFRHKNIKLFITQGGLQSLQESVLNGIPLIGIPFFGDQFTNVNKMVKKGYGLKIDRSTITKNALVTAIKEVIQKPKYTETAQMMGKIFRDEEIPSLQRAVYWTEYVIRHKGAKHLRSPTVDMPAWKYYMLDVVGFLAFISLLIIVLIYLLIKVFIRLVIYIFARLFGKRKPKIKKN
ncbi:unnamed protein product [Psylliodes chrysocephalus]|uniref:Glucuronosyltransferase n=1 Tax=Psylliodes chrysocephalus TaxID=3402493 RepID=A0A9P0GKN7_9CUCU|nr:unnamed protein product [Psylliodes chrysocephala]